MNVWICASCGSVNEFSGNDIFSEECSCCGEHLSAVDREKIKNKKFLTERAAQNHTGALLNLYIEEEKRGNFEESFSYLKKCADLNEPRALYIIATIYMNIDENCELYGVEADEQKAMYYMKKCCEAFCEGGVYFYLFFLLKGMGVEKNEKLALKELLKYADAGVSDCQALLAAEYECGEQVKQSDKKAVYWSQRYMKAVEFFGESPAVYDDKVKYILGKHYMIGKYLKKDINISRDLLEDSYDQGNEAAGLYLCEFVYPYFSDNLNLRTKRLKILSALSKSENQTIARHAQYLRNGQ